MLRPPLPQFQLRNCGSKVAINLGAVAEATAAQPDVAPAVMRAGTSRPKPAWVLPLDPILVDAAAAAALVGVSRAQWFKMDSTGEVPTPVRLAERCVRWRVDELRAWCEAGCPSREKWREQWERIKADEARQGTR
jgi:predicted DNA-binding transcriptional regulator AlpA